jgi:hypothetical protein
LKKKKAYTVGFPGIKEKVGSIAKREVLVGERAPRTAEVIRLADQPSLCATLLCGRRLVQNA